MLLKFLKLIRWPNLVIVFLTQWIVWSHLIKETLSQNSLSSNLSLSQFLLLSLATVLVASAGYIINDIEDVKIDLINKPNRVIIGKQISKKTALLFYKAILICGFLISLLLAFQLDKLPYIFLFPFFAGCLHLYATQLKKTSLFGNILISLFVACVPLIIFLSDANQILLLNTKRTIHIILLYGLLAFLANFARELVKDMQDIKGDAAFGAKTFPIKNGLQNSKSIIYLILFVLFFALISWTFLFDIDNQSTLLILAGTVPLLFICMGLILSLSKAENPEKLGKWSLGIKLFMLFGLLFLYLHTI